VGRFCTHRYTKTLGSFIHSFNPFNLDLLGVYRPGIVQDPEPWSSYASGRIGGLPGSNLALALATPFKPGYIMCMAIAYSTVGTWSSARSWSRKAGCGRVNYHPPPQPPGLEDWILPYS
jgi:hypothetical protein